MRGLAKTSRGHASMELLDRPKPDPAPDEALVAVDYAGMCGSDAGIYEFESAFERMELPTVIGHEYAGRVVEVGDAVTKFAVGDRVVERPIRACGDCYQCDIGEENVCQRAAITGVDHDGAYEPYLAVPERALHPVPDNVDQRHAATVEPTSVGARAVIENSRVRAGDRVMVEGPGPIGLLTAQIARAQGGDVVVTGVGQDADYRLPLAEDLGFETINVAEDDAEERRDELTDGVGYDVVFDTTGHPSGLTGAVDAVRKGGPDRPRRADRRNHDAVLAARARGGRRPVFVRLDVSGLRARPPVDRAWRGRRGDARRRPVLAARRRRGVRGVPRRRNGETDVRRLRTPGVAVDGTARTLRRGSRVAVSPGVGIH
nr:alcohol dehydrogenase catalytic domain-containing protein [Halomicroarcula sp. SYNS111]